MTLTVKSLLCASKSGSIFLNASLRLLAAAIVTVSDAACTDAAVPRVVVKTPRSNRLFNSTFRRVIKYLLIIVMKFIMRLEIELILHIDPVFDEIATESRLALERKPVWSSSAASQCDVGVVDDEPIVIGAVEAVAQSGTELFGDIVFLFRGRIQHPIPKGELELPRNDVFADLHIPAPGLAEIHRRSQDNCGRRSEGNGSIVCTSHPLMPIVAFRLE